MRIFVTGATGFVGSAVVNELIAAGHEVLGLTRSEEGAKSLIAAGAEPFTGNIEDPDGLKKGAFSCDAVIHTAFNHDFSKFAENCETDRKVITALGAALEGSDRPLLITSGIGILTPNGQILNEDDRHASGRNPRTASEDAADAVAAKGVRVALVRLPPSVHGKGDHGFVPMLIGIAREKGISVYKNEGKNYWPAVHRMDAARLFRLVAESKFSPGTRFHAVAEQGVEFREIAEAIGKGLNVPAVSKTEEEAAVHFGWFAHFAGIDCKASAEKTKEMLNWNPSQPGLIEDIAQDSYFTESK